MTDSSVADPCGRLREVRMTTSSTPRRQQNWWGSTHKRVGAGLSLGHCTRGSTAPRRAGNRGWLLANPAIAKTRLVRSEAATCLPGTEPPDHVPASPAWGWNARELARSRKRIGSRTRLALPQYRSSTGLGRGDPRTELECHHANHDRRHAENLYPTELLVEEHRVDKCDDQDAGGGPDRVRDRH